MLSSASNWRRSVSFDGRGSLKRGVRKVVAILVVNVYSLSGISLWSFGL